MRNPLALSGTAGLVMMASAVTLSQSVAQGLPHAPGTPSASAPVASALEAERMTHRVLDYMAAIRERDDISLVRLQSAAGVRLRWLDQQAGYDTPELPGGGWATIVYWDESALSGRAVALQYSNDGAESDPSLICHLPFDDIRRRLFANGFRESRDLGELGEVVVWIFYNSHIRIEISTVDARMAGRSVACVRRIKAVG